MKSITAGEFDESICGEQLTPSTSVMWCCLTAFCNEDNLPTAVIDSGFQQVTLLFPSSTRFADNNTCTGLQVAVILWSSGDRRHWELIGSLDHCLFLTTFHHNVRWRYDLSSVLLKQHNNPYALAKRQNRLLFLTMSVHVSVGLSVCVRVRTPHSN